MERLDGALRNGGGGRHTFWRRARGSCAIFVVLRLEGGWIDSLSAGTQKELLDLCFENNLSSLFNECLHVTHTLWTSSDVLWQGPR